MWKNEIDQTNEERGRMDPELFKQEDGTYRVPTVDEWNDAHKVAIINNFGGKLIPSYDIHHNYRDPSVLCPKILELWNSIPEHIKGDRVIEEILPNGEVGYMFRIGQNASHIWSIAQNAEGTKFWKVSVGDEEIQFSDLFEHESYDDNYDDSGDWVLVCRPLWNEIEDLDNLGYVGHW